MENHSCKKIANHFIYLNMELGRGAFGKVYLGKDTKTSELCAVKMISKKGSIVFPIK